METTFGLRRSTATRAMRFAGLVNDRQVKVIASDATQDRMGDVLEPYGAELDEYRKNPVVLFGHDQMQPVATCAVSVENNAVIGLITFPPAGVSERIDEILRLLKARILNAVSVGFIPNTWEPIKNAGLRFTSWSLLELSIVSVPANPSALVTERSARSLRRIASGSPVVDQLDVQAKAVRLRTLAALKQRVVAPASHIVIDDAGPLTIAEARARVREHRRGLQADPRVAVFNALYRQGLA